jgi:hypothetical protein
MIHNQDFEMLCGLIGTRTLPANVEQECHLWTRLYHSSGSSGPLGAIALIGMIRYLKTEINAEEIAPVAIEWDSLIQDGSVRVEARFAGTWVTGTFVGFSENGLLAIKIDHDSYVRECRRDTVRLSLAPPPVEIDPEIPAIFAPVDPVPYVELLRMAIEQERLEEEVSAVEEPTVLRPLPRWEELPDNVEPTATVSVEAEEVVPEWGEDAVEKVESVVEEEVTPTMEGDHLWVELDDDVSWVKLLKKNEDGSVVIQQADGSERDVAAGQVIKH